MDAAFHTEALFDGAAVVYDPDEPDKKVEPYYFDARRGANAQALDIGFMPDALQMMTTAYPAVEFFALVGLQRGRPDRTVLYGLRYASHNRGYRTADPLKHRLGRQLKLRRLHNRGYRTADPLKLKPRVEGGGP